MAEEDIKKKISNGGVDILNRVNNWIKFGARKATFGYARFKSVKTSVDVPIVRVLRRGSKVVPIFNSHIEKLDRIEKNWGDFQKLWVKLMNYYVGIGLKRSAEYTSNEIAMCKFGSRPSEEQLKKERESIQGGEEETTWGGEASKLSKEEINRLIVDIDESGLRDDEKKKRREEFKKAICPLDNPNFVDWPEIKVKIDNDEEISEIYPLPKEVMLKTWHSLIDDVNFTLDTYPARFFGFEKNTDWSNAFNIVVERMFNKVARKLRDKKVDEKFISGTVLTIGKNAMKALLTNEVLPTVIKFERSLYPYLRRRTQQFAGKISAMGNEIEALQPSNCEKIHFKRTYKIVNPERVVRAKVYNNGYPLYKELVRLNDKLDPKEDLGVRKHLLKIFRWCEDQAERPTGAEHKKGPFFFYLKYKYNDRKRYDYCLMMEKELQKKFEEVNNKLRDKNIGGHYLTWKMMGVSFDNRRGHPDERTPGLDENNWPFEVEKDGTICLDKWEHRLPPRKVPKEFVSDMDLLLMTNVINNEYDALRDDIRDGRYHMNSLTIFEYVLAEMAKWAPESSKLTKKEFKTRFRYEHSINDKSAEYVMTRYGGEEPAKGKRVPLDLNPAFDLRAIKDKTVMNNWIHLGRKRYYDTATAILDQLNGKDLQDEGVLKAIGPTMSTRGLSMYIVEKIMSNIDDFEEAGKILESLADKWYDYGPRGFSKPGPKNPLKLNIQTLNDSLEPTKTLKLVRGVTSTEDKIEPIVEE